MSAPAKPPVRTTAVIYVHGIGDQKRFEEVSDFVDAIDSHLTTDAAAKQTHGLIRGIRALSEPRAGKPDELVGFIEASRIRPKQGEWTDPEQRLRFYEAYWAPILDEPPGNKDVLTWLFGQGAAPIRFLRSAWRESARVRKGVLFEIIDRERANAVGDRPSDRAKTLDRLMRLYNEFDSKVERDRFPKGSYEEFEQRLREEKEPGELLREAQAWRKAYMAEMWKQSVAIAMFFLGLLLIIFLAMVGALQMQQWFGAKLVEVSGWLNVPGYAAENSLWGKLNAALLTLIGVTVLFISKTALGKYLGDVAIWSTYQETNRRYRAREEILCRFEEVVMHVAAQPAVDRIVVVSHSLGTTIAYDGLLHLARRWAAMDAAAKTACGLGKIDTFVTMGAPIDKIHYFFERFQVNRYRFYRTVTEIRGDADTMLFREKPHILWLNLWDAGDLVAGSLESPAGILSEDNPILNVEMVNGRMWSPVVAHHGYKSNPAGTTLIEHVLFTDPLPGAKVRDRRNALRALVVPPSASDRLSIRAQVVALFTAPLLLAALFWVLPAVVGVSAGQWFFILVVTVILIRIVFSKLSRL